MDALKMPKLDLKDRKILTELDWNARLTNSEIGRKNKIGKKVVEYRIKRLEKLKILEGYYPIINFEILGHHLRRVEIIFDSMSPLIKEQIEQYILKTEDFGWALWVLGYTDLMVDIWSQSEKEFKNTFDKFNILFGKYIREKKFSISVGLEQYPLNVLGMTGDRKVIIIDEEKEKANLDKLDRKILRELWKNSRKNSSEIAESIGSNYKTVSYRIKQLERKRIILGYRAIIDNKLLGYNYYKLMLFFNEYSGKIYKNVRDYFRSFDETCYIIYHVSSDFDAEMMFNSDMAFFNFIESLKNKFPHLLKKIEYGIFLKVIKVGYLPKLV